VARTKKKRPEKGLVHDRIVELETAIAGVRDGRKTSPRTARLLAAGLPRIAQKLAEEATEVVIEAVRGQRSAVINESVDLLYNLVVLWSEIGITASEVWAEMDRRQALLGMGEKLPKEVGVGSTSSAAVEVSLLGSPLNEGVEQQVGYVIAE
jgi:phosphoribosyl-ATP pyrophosphohydrolase